MFLDVSANSCLVLKPQSRQKHIIGEYEQGIDGPSLYAESFGTLRGRNEEDLMKKLTPREGERISERRTE